MTTRTRALIATIIALLIASPLVYWQRWAIPGATFIYTMASGACLLLAILAVLFLPWKNPRLAKICRFLRWAYLAAVLALLLSFGLVQKQIWRAAAEARQQQPNAACLLVLGAGLYGDTPSPILQNRLLAALEYLRAHPESQAVLSGGQGPGETVTEASAMQSWLLHNGVSAERLHLEDRATSTGENIAFSQPIIEGLGYSEAVIVTNDFHLLRASLLAANYGLKAQLLGAPVPPYSFNPFVCYSREYFALVKDWLLLNLYTQGLPAINDE